MQQCTEQCKPLHPTAKFMFAKDRTRNDGEPRQYYENHQKCKIFRNFRHFFALWAPISRRCLHRSQRSWCRFEARQSVYLRARFGSDRTYGSWDTSKTTNGARWKLLEKACISSISPQCLNQTQQATMHPIEQKIRDILANIQTELVKWFRSYYNNHQKCKLYKLRAINAEYKTHAWQTLDTKKTLDSHIITLSFRNVMAHRLFVV